MSRNKDQVTTVFHLFRDLGKVMRFFQSDAVFCEGVTFTQFCILNHVISRGGRLDLSELHGLLAVEKSTTTRMVGPLVKRKLIKRKKSTLDSRAIELVMTEIGMDVHEKVWKCVSGFIESFLQRIPSDQRDSMLKTLLFFIQSIKYGCGESANVEYGRG